ncbi:hypothetical protein F5Y19DRAFT_463820 [Xylariaceae sp. FL1651]|nr:hypothetical protein F5Y19DRAFT_463820 [Xylariaceae sp. FL1651]
MNDKSASDQTPGGALLTPNNSVPSGNGDNGTRETEEVDSPVSPSSPNALARFEFEAGRGNEGSKILMVEWDSSHADGRELCPQDREGWIVSWEGKTAAYPQSDNDKGASSMRRVYFLLPENAPIPPAVTISHPPTARMLTTKCMPAIFAPGLGASQLDSGKRGVLHTIWAKKRLAELQEEIDKELQANSEGVALEMAVQEREWVIDHFGFVSLDAQERPAPPPTPQSPRSPIGGRLGEMLKGLKLSTSPTDLANTPTTTPWHTIQSFPPNTSNTASAPKPSMSKPSSGAVVASLDAVMGNTQPVAPVSQSKDTEDELFALPMSPRSPEMKTSPFSLLR